MGQGGAAHIAGLWGEVKAKFATRLKHGFAVFEFSDPEFGALEVCHDGDGPPHFLFNIAHQIITRTVFIMAAMAEIKAKHIDARIKQGVDAFARRTGGSQSGNNFCFTVSTHYLIT
jgi:hypothetical protein